MAINLGTSGSHVKDMPYDMWVHAHMVGLKMGLRNFTDDRPFEVGDTVTNQHGDADTLVGTVEAVHGDDITVRWTSQHIGPVRTTTTKREHLLHTSYATHSAFHGPSHGCFGSGIAAWLLSASDHGWHVCGHAGSGSPTSGYYDGSVSAWRRGHHLSVRFNKDGEITYVRTISQLGTNASALVVDGPGAGHAAMMWLI